MVIKEITLHNFGVYAGTNTIYFSLNKPVVLIGGMNGRGKTTILNAILIALYGANSFAYKESTFSTYGAYLGSFVNENDGSKSSYIELKMTIDDTDDELKIKRSWSKKNAHVKETVEVEKNQRLDNFLTNNWALFIEGMIPSALSQYFFFDGDNIAELATGSIDNKMKQSIKSLLGISNLDMLEKDLRRVKRKAEKDKKNISIKEESEELRRIRDEARQKLEKIDSDIEKLEERKLLVSKELEKRKIDYVAKGGLIVEKRQHLINERSALNAFLIQKENELVESAASNLPLNLVADYLYKIKNKIDSEQKSINLQNAHKTILEVFNSTRMKDDEKKVVHDFISKINTMVENSKSDVVFYASEQLTVQLDNLIDHALSSKKASVNNVKKEKKVLEERIKNIDAQLSVDIDEKNVAKIYADIKRREKEIIDLDESISLLFKKRSEANGSYIKANSLFSRSVEAYLSELDLNDESDRIINYAEKATQILTEYRTELQNKKIDNLAKTITECYQRLRNKENLINEIKMDSKSLDFIYLNKKGIEVPKNSLSQGEKQMMIIAILWALAINSKQKLPVIIDTPLARLDSAHRMALISQYFPNASDQTIILSTDSEIVGDYYKALKDNISNEYTLIYDDEKRCSKIVKGYFGEGQ